jgi:hypothetical protein
VPWRVSTDKNITESVVETQCIASLQNVYRKNKIKQQKQHAEQQLLLCHYGRWRGRAYLAHEQLLYTKTIYGSLGRRQNVDPENF